MITGQTIVDAARTMLGVPFHHQGRNRTAGLDCIGLLVEAANLAGIKLRDVVAYTRRPFDGRLMRELTSQLDEIPLDEAKVGDVVAVALANKEPHHVVLLTDYGIIHTDAHVSKVVETGFGAMKRRARAAFRFRGVE
jgi:cell wall-associated NlpC family hydrolase